jgi:hypothetical protein
MEGFQIGLKLWVSLGVARQPKRVFTKTGRCSESSEMS